MRKSIYVTQHRTYKYLETTPIQTTANTCAYKTLQKIILILYLAVLYRQPWHIWWLTRWLTCYNYVGICPNQTNIWIHNTLYFFYFRLKYVWEIYAWWRFWHAFVYLTSMFSFPGLLNKTARMTIKTRHISIRNKR